MCVVAASILVERTTGGIDVSRLQDLIEQRLNGDFASLLKLRSVVSETLRGGVIPGTGVAFDLEKARQSLAIYNMDEIPAVRGDLEVGVTGVRFRSNLDLCDKAKISELATISTGVLPS